MSSRILAVIGVFLGLARFGVAQQGSCKEVEVPVSVISITGDSFRGLHAEDFTGKLQKRPVSVKSLVFDDGPRRIVIVLDTNKKLSADTRRAQVEMVNVLLAGARPEDSFALVPAHGPGREVNFTTDRSAIKQALSPEGKSGNEAGVLDAVMSGIEMFGAPKPGDAIVIMAADTEGNHKTNAKKVAHALEEHHIRVFGLALGPVSTRNVVAGGSMTSTTSQGLAWTTPGVGNIVYDTGDDNFFPLTVNSGGLVLGVMNMDYRRTYSMSDPNLLQFVQQKARSISRMINSFYRLQIEAPSSHPEDWTLDVNDAIKKHAQQMFVLYPHTLGACSAG